MNQLFEEICSLIDLHLQCSNQNLFSDNRLLIWSKGKARNWICLIIDTSYHSDEYQNIIVFEQSTVVYKWLASLFKINAYLKTMNWFKFQINDSLIEFRGVCLTWLADCVQDHVPLICGFSFVFLSSSCSVNFVLNFLYLLFCIVK